MQTRPLVSRDLHASPLYISSLAVNLIVLHLPPLLNNEGRHANFQRKVSTFGK